MFWIFSNQPTYSAALSGNVVIKDACNKGFDFCFQPGANLFLPKCSKQFLKNEVRDPEWNRFHVAGKDGERVSFEIIFLHSQVQKAGVRGILGNVFRGRLRKLSR